MSALFGTLGWDPIDTRFEPETAKLYTGKSPASGPTNSQDTRIAMQGGVDPQQFTLLQLTDTGLLDLHDVVPSLNGSEAAPDVQTRIQLVSMHLGLEDREVNAGHQASLRLDIGADARSSSQLDPLIWSVAAGIDLAGMLGSGTSARSARVDADLSSGFKQRPIEVPNGLAHLRIEIVAHPEPPAWRRYFSFLARNDEAKRLVSVLGFPGISIQAARLLDQVLDAVDSAKAQVLFRSRPLTIAMNSVAAADYKAGLSNVSVAAINNGYLVMTRFADMHRLLDMRADIEFRGGDGLLVKRGGGILGPEFDEITYAVLRVRSGAFRIAPSV